MKKLLTLLAVLATLVFPALALGQGSGGDQYTEDPPPGTSGNGDPSSNGSENGSAPSGTQSGSAGLNEDGSTAGNSGQTGGADGRGDAGSGLNGNSDGAGSTSSGSASSSDDSGSGFGEAVAELAGGSDDGMGLMLPIILGLVLLAAVGFLIFRRSGGSTGSA